MLDLDAAAHDHRVLATELTAALGQVRINYAVKANPINPVIRLFAEQGARFDVASVGEIELCLAQRVAPAALCYGNPIKKAADIATAHAYGVTRFTFDAAGDLRNLALHAPGARVHCRLRVDAPDSVTPFGGKFGCDQRQAVDLLVRAAELGLDPAGVAFHVGSQQLDVTAWRAGIATSARVFRAAAERGVALRSLNLGGGFAVGYRDPAPSIGDYAGDIRSALATHFPHGPPELAVEPGRAMIAGAGVIKTEVVLVADRDHHRWVYLDIGRYNGLAETENEAITYQIVPPTGTSGGADSPVIIAGPSCDGDDVLYQHTPYRLPESLRAGDELLILRTGAYTASYSSVAFNGIPPLRTYCLSDGRLVDEN